MIKGIGGPGAPHVFSFDRLNDLQIDHSRVNDRFWRRQRVRRSDADVVVRRLCSQCNFFGMVSDIFEVRLVCTVLVKIGSFVIIVRNIASAFKFDRSS